MPTHSVAIEEAERAGFDLSLVDESLSVPCDQRARQHQEALNLALELEAAGRRLRELGAKELRAITEKAN